ncbi:MAG: hypothetical protein H0V20_03085 [Actinobacteria bacterium]|nr:hypothetical protein [Actinomycetota bacterium]
MIRGLRDGRLGIFRTAPGFRLLDLATLVSSVGTPPGEPAPVRGRA